MVHVRGKESGEAMLRHGLPQGSIIEPVFFILFINDLSLHVSADVQGVSKFVSIVYLLKFH